MRVMGKETPKQKIFYAAVDCFSSNSYADSTMEMIARKVGVTAASIYNHYKSKEAILQDICDYYLVHFNRYRVSVDDILKAADTEPMEKVFSMMFYTFGSDEEFELMMKLTKIIVNLRFEHENVRKVFLTCFFEEPQEYGVFVMEKLIEAGKMKPIDTATLSLLMRSVSYITLIHLMIYDETRKTTAPMIDKSIAMLAQLVKD